MVDAQGPGHEVSVPRRKVIAADQQVIAELDNRPKGHWSVFDKRRQTTKHGGSIVTR